MFGTYRFVLALMVVGGHLGGLAILGNYAVFGFFILSGYLMTLIMQQSYGYTFQGALRYALNRFLRIFPIYWVACAFSILLILSFGESFAKDYHHYLYMPKDAAGWLQNIVLIFSYDSEPQLTPPAWALTIELFFYICIGFGLSKSKKVTLVWLALSIAYTIFVNVYDFSWAYKYFYPLAASLPFATGASLFHFRDKLAKITFLNHESFAILLLAAIFLNYVVAHQLGALQSYAFYINYVLNVLIISSLLQMKSLRIYPAVIDRFLGDLSYPIYLIHWQVGFLMLGLGYTAQLGSLFFFWGALPVVLALAWLITRFVEQPIEQLRRMVKESA